MTDPFSIPAFDFPKDFIWGSATAGHQIEGNNRNSNHWFIEIEENKKNPNYELSGLACNSYEMWREDVDILSELKHQMFRMTIEWARIEPAEGQFRQEEVDHYLQILEALKERNIKVCVTLIHSTVPKWFGDKGGISNAANIPYFEKYLHYILPKVAHLVDMWNVLNEINLTSADFKYNAIQFHARGYHIIKQYSGKPVSSAHAFVQQYGKRQWDKFDLALQEYKDNFNNEFFFHAIRTGELVIYGKDALYSPELKDSCDFWSVNTYIRDTLDSRKADFVGQRHPFERVDMLTEPFYLDRINAECIVHNLTRLMDKPVYITENGCSCDDDDFRIVFLAEYLSALSEAIKMGVDVKGYLYWSLLDNYEWCSFKPRFGIVNVDRENGFQRTIKPSGYFLREIIENNGFKPEMLERYLKAVPRATNHFDR